MKNNPKKNILFISQDTDLYRNSIGNEVPGDPLFRHKKYQEILKNNTNKDSQIIIITYTKKNLFEKNFKEGKNVIRIIPSNSIFRSTFFIDVIYQIIKLLKNNWHPNLISTQSTWGEAFIGIIFSKIINCGYLPQIHTDISSIYWFRENIFLNIFRGIQTFLILRFSNLIRTVSYVSSKNISKFYKVNRNKLIVSPVGISLFPVNKELIKKRDITSKKILTILFIGRIELQKDLNLWIDTAFIILKRNKNIRFKIIGDGSQIEKVKSKVYRSEFKKSFEILGSINYKNLTKHYENSDLLFLSSHHEGFGRVVLEAMSFGLPCVSTRSGGPEDLIKNNKNGYIVNNRSPQKIADKICFILDNKKVYRNMSRESLRKSRETFGFDKLSKNYVELLIKACN